MRPLLTLLEDDDERAIESIRAGVAYRFVSVVLSIRSSKRADPAVIRNQQFHVRTPGLIRQPGSHVDLPVRDHADSYGDAEIATAAAPAH